MVNRTPKTLHNARHHNVSIEAVKRLMKQDPGTPRIVPLMDLRTKSLAQRLAELATSAPIASDGLLRDARGRPLRDLRISVTDRCNFRCSYCMPKEVFNGDYKYLPQQSLLTFEEIVRLARQFVNHGVRKIRLTGGEPLLRKNVELLIEQLAGLRTPDGQTLDLTLTTNGSLLARKAAALKSAGLQRLTVSLDGLNDRVFRQMNDVDFPVADVLEGIEAAHRVGLGPIKVNMVVKRGTNVQEILPMARHFRGSGMVVRYIEYMDVGSSNGWRMDDVVPSSEVIEILKSEFPLVALDPAAPGETAQRWGYANSQGEHDTSAGEIGVISSVTQAFCADCNRARLSTEGKIFLCLFASQGHDLRGLLRGEASDEQLGSAIGHIWHSRDDRYSELRATQEAGQTEVTNTTEGATVAPRVEMSYIGG